MGHKSRSDCLQVVRVLIKRGRQKKKKKKTLEWQRDFMEQGGLELSFTWKGWSSRAGSPSRRAIRECAEAAQHKT